MPDIKLLTRDENTGRITLGMPRPPESVSGIDLLVQIVAILFLNNGSRSIFRPGRVGGLRNFISYNFDLNDESELFADMRLMVSRVEQTIKEEQATTNRPPSERLQALQLIDIVPNEEQLAVELIIAVVNEEQQTEQAVVSG